jgi:hypothetical protein
MKLQYLVWLRNVLIVLFFANLAYSLYQRFYLKHLVEWNSSTFISLSSGAAGLQLLITKKCEGV